MFLYGRCKFIVMLFHMFFNKILDNNYCFTYILLWNISLQLLLKTSQMTEKKKVYLKNVHRIQCTEKVVYKKYIKIITLVHLKTFLRSSYPTHTANYNTLIPSQLSGVKSFTTLNLVSRKKGMMNSWTNQ